MDDKMITSFGSKLVSCTCGAGEKHVGLPYKCWSAIKYNERQFWLQVANIVSVAIQTFEDYTCVVMQKELILFVENICCFISVIGSAITTTILKREVILM